MMQIIKALIRKYFPTKVKNIFIEEAIDKLNTSFNKKLEYVNISYAQEGEDLILKRILNEKKNGFFIDIGAHHPMRFSNTFLFYKMGWRGINIDAMPESMNLFNELRQEDINLESAVSDSSKSIDFYIFKETALNTFDKALAQEYINNGWELNYKKEISPKTLATILDENLRTSKTIDFVSIDVEGFELNVLKSNNWDKYNPEIFLIEDLAFDMEKIDQNEIYKFMKNHNYDLIAKTINTVFYRINSH